ncbi:hypothetical protein CC1G_05378 [Coprinopsis cinerea okayama7|uniref:Uncharacterized protein n=1 Tax=Coprinopsis cinerea (strain Okayama-7 / 130 / ATCC MYA-4618 / FGSC 9003) TaxID=240176 RepID=A8NPW1_COPC7|nr:hypothetical protein CC1G_05378 [Coprinopsis cinerea okayama7\|eukprot:XP_001835416.2 hypothetical protein CC1G_05378 [Coprinopsis cinerea okayama7\
MSTKPDQSFTAQDSRAYSALRNFVRGEVWVKIYRAISEDPTSDTALLEGHLDDDSRFDEYLRQYFAEKKEDLKKHLNIPASDSTFKKRCSQIAENLFSAAIGATPRVKVTFSTATKTIMDDLNLGVYCAGPLTESRIAEFIKLVDKVHSCGLDKHIDDLLRAEGGNLDPERRRLKRTVSGSNEAECRMLIDLTLDRAVALSNGITGKYECIRVEVALAETPRSSENATGIGGPVDVTSRDGKIYSFTGIVDYIVTLSSDDLRVLDLPAKLVSIAAADELQMAILEAKHEMTEEELMRHLPQLVTQAIVTIKVLRWNALACILSDGFQYIFAVMERVDATSDKYILYHYKSFQFIDNHVPGLEKAKLLLAMITSWGVLNPELDIRPKVKNHADSFVSGI